MRLAALPAGERGSQGKQRRGIFRYVSAQTGEQPLTRYQGAFKCRYGYGRAAETVHQGDSGQDFAAVRMDGNVCTFVMCDGVGMSYLGDFAARFLGNALLEWLEKTSNPTVEAMEHLLQELTVPASEQLKKIQLLDNSPLLLREVLMEKRSRGSQAMYVCGRIELSRGMGKSRIWMAWQGDSRIRLWRNGQEQSGAFQNHCRTNERWSTLEGPVGGKPNIYEAKLSNEPIRLQLYTDGLNDLDAIQAYIPDEHIQVLLDAAHTGGLEDDAAFIELEW
ncbi:protein phosphatase 2C domain-containing protein [Paenibacillus illinoisensis]|uniref:protein phosphatase 2C domain-containing protein n=1 Tax=Paenibacillus illinoisensis TaxID=59845 RepID=UPI00203A501B|nr:protein phosphatase 2C domain-containing protein [Paenibacillus illinoisensis]MCM3204994.1 protein phosphatase 2C domain-containing protein [Paenibacillus illinoisensis]